MQSSLIAAKWDDSAGNGHQRLRHQLGHKAAIHGQELLGLTFHESMLRTDEQGELKKALAPDELARRKAGARRTAWIIAAVAAAFFIASLVQGHLAHIPR